jgi:hypothetical protein
MSKKRPGQLVPAISDLATDLDRLFLHDWADKGTAAQLRRIAVLIARDRIRRRLRELRPTAEIIAFRRPTPPLQRTVEIAGSGRNRSRR